jgi:hypothetical protein
MTAIAIASRAALDRLLDGESFGAAELDVLMSEAPNEDQWLEYKDGRLMAKGDVPLKDTIREYVTGFANSDGGILVVGVGKEIPRKVSGIAEQGRAPLTEWATTVLQGFATQFETFPRIISFQSIGQDVLVIATGRAPQLIPFTRNGEVHYALRFHEVTRSMPEHLSTDLILGRRRHPVLRLFNVKPGPTSAVNDGIMNFDLGLNVENASFVEAESVRVGVVSKLLSSRDVDPPHYLMRYIRNEDVSPELIQRIRVGIVRTQAYWTVRHSKGGRNPDSIIKPFDQILETFNIFASLPHHSGSGTLLFAIYVMARGSPPEWYQATWRYELDGGNANTMMVAGKIEVDRLRSSKPRLAWEDAQPT